MYSARTLVTALVFRHAVRVVDRGSPPGGVWLVRDPHHPEALVVHRNARLTEHGRRLIVERVLHQGRRRSHVAAERGVSRQCVSHWINRYLAEGDAGLADRSSRPRSCPTRTLAEVQAQILALRSEHRRGQDWIGAELGVPARTGVANPAPAPGAVAARARPVDRRGGPGEQDHRGPLRTRPAWRAGAHGRQEDRQDPRRRGPACARPGGGQHRP